MLMKILYCVIKKYTNSPEEIFFVSWEKKLVQFQAKYLRKRLNRNWRVWVASVYLKKESELVYED